MNFIFPIFLVAVLYFCCSVYATSTISSSSSGSSSGILQVKGEKGENSKGFRGRERTEYDDVPNEGAFIKVKTVQMDKSNEKNMVSGWNTFPSQSLGLEWRNVVESGRLNYMNEEGPSFPEANQQGYTFNDGQLYWNGFPCQRIVEMQDRVVRPRRNLCHPYFKMQQEHAYPGISSSEE